MRLKTTESSVYVWLSARDTYYWADDNWPGSTLADRRVFAKLDTGDLVDLTVDGSYDVDVDGTELTAILSDHLRERLSPEHPCYPT